jgi:hypothetical protein
MAALSTIGTKDFETTWLDFRYGWKRVRCPWGQGVVEQAFSEAMNSLAPAAALRYESEPVRLLVPLCAALQRACRADPFYLGCRTVARLLEIDHATAARWLEALVDDGVLAIVERGGMPDAPRSATRYRYGAGGENPPERA